MTPETRTKIIGGLVLVGSAVGLYLVLNAIEKPKKLNGRNRK